MTATRPADDAGVAVVPGAERAGGQGVPGGLSAPPVRGASEAVGSRREILYFVLRSRKVIVAAVSSVRVWASCITEYLMEGSGMTMWVQGAESTEVEQIVSARTAARSLVRDMARQQLQGDQLHAIR